MLVVITFNSDEDNEVKHLEVDPLLDFYSFKGIIEIETGIPIKKQIVIHGGLFLVSEKHTTQEDCIFVEDTKTLEDLNICENDTIFVEDASRDRSIFLEKHIDREAQISIEESIAKRNIHENFQNAINIHPETFISVNMLFVDCILNGSKLKAFVDTGAQATIMTKECAQKLNLARLMDTRFKGLASGVGEAVLLGRIHSISIEFPICVEESEIGSKRNTVPINCSISILDIEGHMSKGIDLILGLDTLKRYTMIIDLENSCLALKQNKDQNILRIPFVEDLEHDIVHYGDQGAQGLSENKIHIIQKILPNIERSRVVKALLMTNGDIDLAASILFSEDH